RTFHGFQTSIGHGGRSPYGSNHFSSSSLTNGVIHGSNGTLTLGGYNASSVTLIASGNGIIGSSTIGFSETLNLGGTNTTGQSNPSNVLTFSNSSSVTWGNSTLTITGWNANGLVTFGNSVLPGSQLSQIQFVNPNPITHTFSLETVPEPSVALLGTTAALFLVRRRR
ncbi:MAG TPA: hypothetical protein VM511_10370, partial [Luteolibacter sp.]|nr:hypothetical protein [Luteolibacter sp.]